MPGQRIPDLTAIAGASTANDDNLVIFDTSLNTTKRILRSQLAVGLVGDLPYTPSGGIAATTIPTAIAELDSEAVKKAAFALTPQNFSGNNSTVAFTLSVTPTSENFTWVFVSGVYQQKNTYTVSGTTLTFSSAPPLGTNNIEVITLGF
jgi:hypothetical protein